eukprot:SAG31_NODE_1390_length_8539_cov_12.684834_8_plen_354_part_00
MGIGEPKAAEMLAAGFDHPVLHSIILPAPGKFDSKVTVWTGWTVRLKDAAGRAARRAPLPLAQAVEALEAALDCKRTYISVAQDAAGRHRFVRLSDVIASCCAGGEGSCLFHDESAVKKIFDARMLYARPDDGQNDQPGMQMCEHLSSMDDDARSTESSAINIDLMALVSDELAPHTGFTNYSIVPWLCLGRTQRVILCDEATLTKVQPKDRIFESVTLVVNCHEAKCDPAKYKACAAAGSQLEVIANAVHEWYGDTAGAVAKNDAIQRAMWRHLDAGGSVAVHCLAGIHRAACVVACHFLFRHYSLGHPVPHDTDGVYRMLKSVRPHVSPAYGHVLEAYAAEVQRKGISSGA